MKEDSVHVTPLGLLGLSAITCKKFHTRIATQSRLSMQCVQYHHVLNVQTANGPVFHGIYNSSHVIAKIGVSIAMQWQTTYTAYARGI